LTEQLKLDPVSTALLVMDYQVGLLERLPAAPVLLGKAQAAVAELRGRGGQVGWVRVAFTDADFAAIPATSVLARLATPDRRTALHANAPASLLHPELDIQPQDIAVRKVRVGAFSTTDLDQQLRGRSVDTLREAMDRDYRIMVLKDACADPEPDDHAFLISKIYPRYATVIAVAELPGLWSDTP